MIRSIVLALCLLAGVTPSYGAVISGGGTGSGSGVSGTAGAPLFVQTATATAVTAAAETTIVSTGTGSLTIPATWFTAAGTVMDVRFSGKYSTGAVPGTLQLKLKFGATVVGQTAAFTPIISVTDGVYSGFIRLVARTVGATGTIFVADGLLTTGSTITPGETIFSNPTLGTAVTIDTTGTNVVDLTATWGTGATNSITGYTFELVGPGSAVSSVFGMTGAIANLSGDVTTTGSSVATISANAVALGTDTTGNYAAGDAEAGAATSGDSATSFFSSGTLEDARLPSSMASKSITGSLNIPNSITLPATCTVGDLYMDTDATTGQRIYACQATNTWALQGDGGGGGAGTVTVVGAGALTSTALVTGGGTTTLQTPSATATMDASGNISTPGSISTGVGGSAAGFHEFGQGTAPSLGTTSVKLYAPTSVTSYGIVLPGASATGFMLGTDATNVNTVSYVGFSGTGNVARVASPTLTGTPEIAAATATTPSANDNDTSVATTAYVQTELTAYASDTVTNTNKTTDCEATGNVCTTPKRIWLPAAGCNNATAGSVWDLPTSNPAVAACVTGTNTQKGVLDFADGANSLSAQLTYPLPTTWTGTVDARIKWFSATTTGDVVWQLATICVADAETDDPAFNTASTVTDTAKGTTLQTNDAAITTVTVTGCAAGELMHIKIFRDPAHASDTHAATARLVGVELVIREAI